MKDIVGEPNASAYRPKDTLWRTTWGTRYSVLLLGVLCVGYHSKHFIKPTPLDTARETKGCHGGQGNNPEVIWEKIQPSKDLSWSLCYGDKQCARLEVPLDYAEPDGKKGAVALIRIPSKLAPGEDGYRGPVLLNPGGPGISGVDLVLEAGNHFAQILGNDYDIVGFDPRGVERTIPKINAFVNLAERTSWSLKAQEDPLPNATTDAIARLYARAQVFSSLAEVRTNDTSPYSTTAMTARDMLSITHAHGRDKLQYWGFSYGSVLGATFAAMFPNHIERMIIDGVADPEDYFATRWSNNLVTTDRGFHIFAEQCVESGKDVCALYRPTAEEVLSRINDIFSTLKRRPIAMPINGKGDYELVDYSLARQVMFGYLYKPYFNKLQILTASTVATAFAAAEKGDGAPLVKINRLIRLQWHFKCGCDTPEPIRLEPAVAIACTDGDAVHDTVEDLEDSYKKIAQDSQFADIWASDGRMNCVGWKIRPKERFTGPFIGNTSHPILVIGNTADHVTPLVNAHKIAKGYKGAVVLTQNSAGHCSLSATSSCTLRHIRDYFRNGTLPEPGTVCEISDRMFADANTLGEDDMPNDNTDTAVGAWQDLSGVFRPTMSRRLGF